MVGEGALNVVSAAGKFLMLLVVFPIALIVIPILTLLGLNKLNADADYVAGYLEKFISGTEGPWDWDDFCSIPLTDERLNGIVLAACQFAPPAPLGDDERDELRQLLVAVRKS